MRIPRTACSLLVACVLALAACGSSSKSSAPPSSASTTTPASVPHHIVSLSPTATEMLYAIGAGPQVKAVDDQSNYPQGAPRTKLSGFQPNVEAIANENPDLVVMSDASVEKQLEKLGIKVYVGAAAQTLADTYTQIRDLGRLTGHAGNAEQLVAQMQRQIATLQASVPANAAPLSYYYELDNTYYSATSKTFVGAILAMAHLRNIADAADAKSSGYPQLSPEYILQQDPQIVFLADTKCCHQSAATVAARPGWSALQAVKRGDVVALDDDIASRWGPRVVTLLRTILTAVAHARSG